jgi:hypothetical protein
MDGEIAQVIGRRELGDGESEVVYQITAPDGRVSYRGELFKKDRVGNKTVDYGSSCPALLTLILPNQR